MSTARKIWVFRRSLWGLRRQVWTQGLTVLSQCLPPYWHHQRSSLWGLVLELCLGGKYVIAFGGILELDARGIHSSDRIRAQPNADITQTRRAGALRRARLPSVFSSCRMGVLPVHDPCAADAWFCSVQSSCKSCLPLEAAWLAGVGCLHILVSGCGVLPALLCVLLLFSLLYESVCCFGVGRMVPFERGKYPMILHLRCYHAIILKKF
jgi:hypothetical protein